MKKELFKDKDLILRINFRTLKPNNIKNKLIKNGWIIDEEKTDDGINVKLYEDQEEKDWYSFMCEDTNKTFDKALINCLKTIKDYYIKVS